MFSWKGGREQEKSKRKEKKYQRIKLQAFKGQWPTSSKCCWAFSAVTQMDSKHKSTEYWQQDTQDPTLVPPTQDNPRQHAHVCEVCTQSFSGFYNIYFRNINPLWKITCDLNNSRSSSCVQLVCLNSSQSCWTLVSYVSNWFMIIPISMSHWQCVSVTCITLGLS